MADQAYTHFHQGEIVVYLAAAGCPYEYRANGFECPACGDSHRCGNGCG